MKLRTFVLTALLGGASAHPAAASSFTVDLYESGNDVVGVGSGTFDLTGLTPFTGTSPSGYLIPSTATFTLGETTTVELYVGITGPASFGPGPYLASQSDTGPATGLNGNFGGIWFPDTYVPGTLLSNSSTWTNATLASLGITPGIYTWSWDGGANTLTLNAGPVPEPSAYGWAFFLATAGLVGWRRLLARQA